MLNDCLDPKRKGDSVDDIDSLAECCQMEKDCEKELEDAQECVVDLCLDPCIRDTAREYLECIEDQNDGVTDKKCSRQQCLDGFLNDLEEEADASGDILDLKNVEKRLKNLQQEDLEDCALLDQFVETACGIGDDCCSKCTEDLSEVVDCLINDIVIPFTAIQLNTTIDFCEISEDCSLVLPDGTRKRRATANEGDTLFERALQLPKSNNAQSKRDVGFEASIIKARKNRVLEEAKTPAEIVEICEEALSMNAIVHNMTYAVSVFMECVTEAAIDALPMTDNYESTTSTAAYDAPYLVTTLVAAVVGSYFVL